MRVRKLEIEKKLLDMKSTSLTTRVEEKRSRREIEDQNNQILIYSQKGFPLRSTSCISSNRLSEYIKSPNQ